MSPSSPPAACGLRRLRSLLWISVGVALAAAVLAVPAAAQEDSEFDPTVELPATCRDLLVTCITGTNETSLSIDACLNPDSLDGVTACCESSELWELGKECNNDGEDEDAEDSCSEADLKAWTDEFTGMLAQCANLSSDSDDNADDTNEEDTGGFNFRVLLIPAGILLACLLVMVVLWYIKKRKIASQMVPPDSTVY